MEFFDVLRGRNSTRAFQSKPVPQELIDEILADALTAPSSSNTQAYRVAIATGSVREAIAKDLTSKFDKAVTLQGLKGPKKIIKGLSSGALPNGDFKPDINYPKELKQRAVECGKGLYELMGIARNDRKARDAWMRRNFHFFDAPVEIFLFVHGERGVYSALDGGLFLQNLMLSAKARGLGTCAQASVAMWGGTVRKYFDIEPEYKLICGLCLGYPSEDSINTYQPNKRQVSDICFPVKK